MSNVKFCMYINIYYQLSLPRYLYYFCPNNKFCIRFLILNTFKSNFLRDNSKKRDNGNLFLVSMYFIYFINFCILNKLIL